MALRCWFFWAWWLPLMLVVTAEEEAEECSGSAKICGNLTISDPFWLVNKETGRSCGSPDFQLTCYNNTSFLRSTGSVGFTIINITYQEHSMRAIDQGKLELLHDSNSCYVSWNTSVKLGSSFRISPANQNLILYNCTATAAAAARRDGALVETTIRCGNESGVFARVEEFYDGTTNNADYAVEGCEAIVVPVVGSSGEANASDYEQLITDGFLLTWDGHPPLPLARKFAHPSNHLSPKFLPRMSRNAFGFLLTWDGPLVSRKFTRPNASFSSKSYLLIAKSIFNIGI